MEGKREGQKSEVYAAIALHNLEQDFQLLGDASEAYFCDEIPTFLQYIGGKYTNAKKLLTAQEENNSKIKKNKRKTYSVIHSHKPEDFDIREQHHNFQPQNSICLILPCSQEKPYPSSQSFKFVWKKLQESLGDARLKDIEIIFLSGLYGPVPIAYVDQDAVKTYDFLLHSHDKIGIERITERLSSFLNTHGKHFKSILAYVTLPAYRKAVETVNRAYPKLIVLPSAIPKEALGHAIWMFL